MKDILFSSIATRRTYLIKPKKKEIYIAILTSERYHRYPEDYWVINCIDLTGSFINDYYTLNLLYSTREDNAYLLNVAGIYLPKPNWFCRWILTRNIVRCLYGKWR